MCNGLHKNEIWSQKSVQNGWDKNKMTKEIYSKIYK